MEIPYDLDSKMLHRLKTGDVGAFVSDIKLNKVKNQNSC